MAGCSCPAGVRGRRGHSPDERGRLRTERAPGRVRGLAAEAAIASPGSYQGPGRARPRPRFTAGECLLRTPRTGGRRFPHRGGGSSSGGLRPQRSHSIFGWFRRDWRVEAAVSKSAALWQGRGFAGEARLLASHAGHRPDSPRENRSLVEGPARPPGTVPPGAEPWPAPLPGTRSLVLSWESASAGVGELLGSVVHGKTRGPLGGREGLR